MTYYITTPIYYVNDVPHIGHAYTNVASDIIARYMRLKGHDTFFLTGTDEHGQKVQKAAAVKNINPQEFTDQVSERFATVFKILNISNDIFMRTTSPNHKKAVAALWKKLEENGDIYLGKYAGWYAVRDEAFYDEAEIVDGKAPTGAPVEWIEEPSYFFALSKWQDKLLDFYTLHPDFVRPQSRYNEVISFVKSGLTDLSISRTSFNWGIPVPSDVTHEHVIYVWLDALTNYISALQYPDTKGDLWKFWPANVHVVGKDILRFHAVYWPAFLMAADIAPPKCIMAHGWWTNEGQKISKSLGNVIDPVELVRTFGLDQVRYFLIREVTFGNDGNFSRSALHTRINTELVNKLGNLVQRTLVFINKNCDCLVPQPMANVYDQEILEKAQGVVHLIDQHINNFELTAALYKIMDLVEDANIYIDDKAPWKLKNTDIRAAILLLVALRNVCRICIYTSRNSLRSRINDGVIWK